MVIEAVDFMGMGASGDQHMADAEASAERKPSSSSPERDPDRGADPTPRSPAGSSARESEGPGEAETKGEEKRVKLEVEGQGEAKKARTSPPRSPGVASDKPPTTGIQVTEEEYRLFLQFRGMQQQLQQAKLSQARQAGAQERSPRVSPACSGGDAPSQTAATFGNVGHLSVSSFTDQHNRIIQARFAQALQAESQLKQDSSAGPGHGARSPVPASPAALSLAIPAATNGQNFHSGVSHQGGFGSPIPGLQRVNGRQVMLSPAPNLSAYLASQRALPQSSSNPVLRPAAAQPVAPSRPTGASAVGGKPTAQLTIFYSGEVNVYDDVPEDKARAIMLLAGNESTFSCLLQPPPVPPVAAGNSKSATVATPGPAPSPSSSGGGPMSKPSQRPRIASGISAELPQARKASLARFLEKRKDRARAKAPYSLLVNSSDRKMSPFDKPPSPPQNRSVVAHSGQAPSPPPLCASLPVSSSSPIRQQHLLCGNSSQQGHGSDDHGGLSRMRCSGIDVAVGSDGPSGTSALQPQLQQQQLEIH